MDTNSTRRQFPPYTPTTNLDNVCPRRDADDDGSTLLAEVRDEERALFRAAQTSDDDDLGRQHAAQGVDGPLPLDIMVKLLGL